jgi:putative flippase GtrA
MDDRSLTAKLAGNEVIRFVFSAGTAFLVDVAAFYILNHYLLDRKSYLFGSFSFSNYTLCLAISFFLGVVVNFFITRYLVFYQSQTHPSKQFIRFASVAVVGYFANLAVIRFLIEKLHLNPDISRITAALSLFFASFFIHKLFSFSLSLRNHESGTSNRTGSRNF